MGEWENLFILPYSCRFIQEITNAWATLKASWAIGFPNNCQIIPMAFRIPLYLYIDTYSQRAIHFIADTLP